MTNISVIFELPVEIAKGLADGTLERVGGVIRNVGDKKVVVWLTEAGEKSIENSSLPSTLSSPQMLMGMQVANLAVNVAGFALIYHKLKQVERQLQGVEQQLKRVAEDQLFLDQKHMIAQLSPVAASLQTLAGIHRINDSSIARDKLISADDSLGEAGIYFREILGHMLAKKFEQQRPNEFAACYRAWMMASQGHVETMIQLGEIPEALARAERLQLEHQNFAREFMAVRRDYLRKLLTERTQDYAEATLKQLGQQCAGVHDIIKGKTIQLEYMRDNNLRLEDFPPVKSSEDKGYALLYFDKA